MFRGLLSVGVLVVFPAAALAHQPCSTDARHVVDELSRHVLERAAGPGSLDAFYRLDRNHDNRLTRAEMGSASNSSPFAMIDTHGDGRITRDEFRTGAVPRSGR
jgi:EF hand